MVALSPEPEPTTWRSNRDFVGVSALTSTVTETAPFTGPPQLRQVDRGLREVSLLLS
jgi:hypothetical protein